MKRIVFASFVFAALVAIAPAQVTKPVGLSVRAGLIFPTSGFGRDLGRTWFGIGGEYKVKDARYGEVNPGFSGMITLSADYYGKGSGSSVPVLLNYVGMQNEFFYSAGAGLAMTRDQVAAAGGGFNSRNKTNFAYQFGAGYNFQSGTNPLFVEVKYWGNGNSNLNAFGAYVGIRL